MVKTCCFVRSRRSSKKIGGLAVLLSPYGLVYPKIQWLRKSFSQLKWPFWSTMFGQTWSPPNPIQGDGCVGWDSRPFLSSSRHGWPWLSNWLSIKTTMVTWGSPISFQKPRSSLDRLAFRRYRPTILLQRAGKAVFTPEPKFWAHSPASLVVARKCCVLTYVVGQKYMDQNLKKIVIKVPGTLHVDIGGLLSALWHAQWFP